MKQLNDTQWSTTKDFVQQHLKSGERILAPKQFKHQLSNLYGYNFTYELPAEQFQWVIIHKGTLSAIDGEFLKQSVQTLTPVFANDVFVVLTSRPDVPQLSDTTHLQPLLQVVNPLQSNNHAAPSLTQTLFHPLRSMKQRLADPRIEGISAQLSAILNRLNSLEKTTRRLKREVENTKAPVRSSLVMASMSLEDLRSSCREACQTAYLGDNTILCRVLANYLLYGDTRDIGIVPHLCLNGFWEPWVTLAMLRTLKPGWNCLDVGANHGYYSLVMSSVIGPSGRVIALEPNRHLAELVRKTLEVNGFNDRAKSMANAVSSKPGEIVKLVIPPGHTGHASIKHKVEAGDEVMEVETVTVDQLTADWSHVDFIKVDVEGAEEAVWRGMQETVRRNKDIVIVLEFGAARYADSRAFLESIVAEGFILRYIDYDTTPKELTIERCLTERPNSYWDLYLSRT